MTPRPRPHGRRVVKGRQRLIAELLGPAGFVIVVSFIMIGFGINDARDTRDLALYGRTTTATVVDFRCGRGCTLVATYEVDGSSVRSESGRFHEDLEVDDQVVVEYAANRPNLFQTALWAEWEDEYLWSRVWGGAGATLLLSAIVYCVAQAVRR